MVEGSEPLRNLKGILAVYGARGRLVHVESVFDKSLFFMTGFIAKELGIDTVSPSFASTTVVLIPIFTTVPS